MAVEAAPPARGWVPPWATGWWRSGGRPPRPGRANHSPSRTASSRPATPGRTGDYATITTNV